MSPAPAWPGARRKTSRASRPAGSSLLDTGGDSCASRNPAPKCWAVYSGLWRSPDHSEHDSSPRWRRSTEQVGGGRLIDILGQLQTLVNILVIYLGLVSQLLSVGLLVCTLATSARGSCSSSASSIPTAYSSPPFSISHSDDQRVPSGYLLMMEALLCTVHPLLITEGGLLCNNEIWIPIAPHPLLDLLVSFLIIYLVAYAGVFVDLHLVAGIDDSHQISRYGR